MLLKEPLTPTRIEQLLHIKKKGLVWVGDLISKDARLDGEKRNAY